MSFLCVVLEPKPHNRCCTAFFFRGQNYKEQSKNDIPMQCFPRNINQGVLQDQIIRQDVYPSHTWWFFPAHVCINMHTHPQLLFLWYFSTHAVRLEVRPQCLGWRLICIEETSTKNKHPNFPPVPLQCPHPLIHAPNYTNGEQLQQNCLEEPIFVKVICIKSPQFCWVSASEVMEWSDNTWYRGAGQLPTYSGEQWNEGKTKNCNHSPSSTLFLARHVKEYTMDLLRSAVPQDEDHLHVIFVAL